MAKDERGDADPMSWSCSAMSWKNFWRAASWTCGTLIPPKGGLPGMIDDGVGEEGGAGEGDGGGPIDKPRPVITALFSA